MERFNSIYPFTTENIAGYMKDLDLTDKRIITVTGSADHILNAILKGATEITTFDVNPLTKMYMDLKISAISSLSYNEFIYFLLFESDISLDYKIVQRLNMPDESKIFWLNQLEKYNNIGGNLRNSSLFNIKHFNPNSKLWQNLYLEPNAFEQLKQRLRNAKIKFINSSLQNLEIDEEYDYMFLSNISDYLNLMFENDLLKEYRDLIVKFQEKIKIIYFAYLYDVGNKNPRSEIDDLRKVRDIFLDFKQVEFKSALEGKTDYQKDCVLIKERGENKNVRK